MSNKDWWCGSIGSKHEALSSNPSAAKNNKISKKKKLSNNSQLNMCQVVFNIK
jgi:hypothetical protein